MCTDLEAEDPCTVCGHAAGHHKNADACRFEDCTCPCLDGPPPRQSYGDQIAAMGNAGKGVYPSDEEGHTSRDGHWPASIGNMGPEK